MPLSLRNPRVESLARRVAVRSGYNITDTIQQALELMDNQLDHNTEALTARLTRISAHCSSLPDLDGRSANEILGYGPDGLLQ